MCKGGKLAQLFLLFFVEFFSIIILRKGLLGRGNRLAGWEGWPYPQSQAKDRSEPMVVNPFCTIK